MVWMKNLNLLIDTELYHRMRVKYGMPAIIDDVLTANREHDNRTSSVVELITTPLFLTHLELGW